MAIEHVAGSTDPVVTNVSSSETDRKTTTVTIEGPRDLLESITDLSSYVPSGMNLKDKKITGDGSGFARIELFCIGYTADDATTIPTHITWRIEMSEVQTPLQCHPTIVTARKDIERWLATSAANRYDAQGNPQWVDEEGTPHPLNDNRVTKFVAAYNAGIETYNRYFPVVEKISNYNRLPGGSMSGNQTTGGNVSNFSANIGKWNQPGLSLNGYASTGWFKSADSYAQGNNTVWTRTEQWTWTPDGSGSAHAWIYASST